MNLGRKIAFGCHVFCILVISAMGLVYLFTPQFMPYHQKAIETSWEDLNPQYQTAVMASIRTVSGGFLAAGLSLGFLLGVPFRKGEKWASWAMMGVVLTVGLPALYALLLIKTKTPANPPYPVLVGWLVVAGVAFVLGISGKQEK